MKELASRYEYFLFDCDGVLWNDKHHIGQSFRNIEWLESQGKQVYFVTNNATISRETMARKMKGGEF